MSAPATPAGIAIAALHQSSAAEQRAADAAICDALVEEWRAYLDTMPEATIPHSERVYVKGRINAFAEVAAVIRAGGK